MKTIKVTKGATVSVSDTYSYDLRGNRTTKTVGNTTTEYVWDGQNLAAETKQGTTDNPNSCFYSCNTATPSDDGSSFAQSWVNRTGGKTWAIYERSDYGAINNLDNWESVIKPERKKMGYRPSGSDYYPIPSSVRNAYWKTFSHNVTIRGAK